MAELNKSEMTPFQAEQIKAAKKIIHYKLGAESNIVSIIYYHPDLLYDSNLKPENFHNHNWKTYFTIAYGIVILEKKEVLDDITVGFYLEKHPDLKKEYEESGGYNTIIETEQYIQKENFNGYVDELKKWNALIKLLKKGFPVSEKLQDFIKLNAEDIYNEYSAFLNDTFVDIDNDFKSYDICHNIHGLIDELDVGLAVGLPYYDMPILTSETGGQYLGSITLIGGISNAGKSTVARSTTLPSILSLNEKVVVMVNEDSLIKWQREMLVWICNNVLKFDIQKHTIRDGKFSDEVKLKLHEAAQWLEDKSKDHSITVIPFQQYKTSQAIKAVKKYAALGVKYFILDTFKMDAGKITGNAWLEMQQSMVSIKDTVKTESLNVHILITFQLEKGSSVMRYYTQNNIGMAKNIVDVASTCIMIRDIFDDEYTGEKRALKVYRLEGKNGKTKITVPLDKDKNYQVFFIVKNQEGAANKYQIVAEHDKSRNILKEIGITNISPDSF